MSGRRNVLEKQRQREIEAAIGAEADLLLMKNSVGIAKFFDDNGKQFVVPYGLGVGSPDLVGILRISTDADRFRKSNAARAASIPARAVEDGSAEPSPSWPAPASGIWFCLEVKADEGDLSPEQRKCHEVWRSFGAIVEVVRSADDARAALQRARERFAGKAAA